MSFLSHFRNVSEADKSKAVEKLIKDSTPDYDFFLMMALSVLMATSGLLLDNAAVVIGSMLITPVLFPVLSLSLGMVMADQKLMSRSTTTIIRSLVVGIVASVVVALLYLIVFDKPLVPTFEILLRTEPSLFTFFIAVIAGVAVSVALVRPELSATLPGIAVSVALIPPLATIGIGLAWFDWAVVGGASLLLFLNIIGIVFASLASFSILNLYVKRDVAKDTIKKEEARVEREGERAEKLEKEV